MCPYLSKAVETTSLPEIPLPKGDLILIGWREWLQLPQLSPKQIKSKIDTGARSSSLHVAAYEILDSSSEAQVRIQLDAPKASPLLLPLHDRRVVRDSGGHEEERPYILTKASMGGLEWEIELSLTSREGMRFPMLLGRKALAERFAISPSQSYLLGKKQKKRRKKK